MSQQAAIQRMGIDEFFLWLKTQDRKFELVNGEPVMMAGASLDHNDIVTSGMSAFKTQLKGKPCRVIGSDVAIKIPTANIRYPDFGVDCGTKIGSSMTAISPTVIAEVLSPSTEIFDFNTKVQEYKTVDTVKYILLIKQDLPMVQLFSRNKDDKWDLVTITGLEATVDLPEQGLTLALSDLYEGIQLPFRPSLVMPDEPKHPGPKV